MNSCSRHITETKNAAMLKKAAWHTMKNVGNPAVR